MGDGPSSLRLSTLAGANGSTWPLLEFFRTNLQRSTGNGIQRGHREALRNSLQSRKVPAGQPNRQLFIKGLPTCRHRRHWHALNTMYYKAVICQPGVIRVLRVSSGGSVDLPS